MSATCDRREHGLYTSHPLSVMCLRILKLKYLFICFGSCASSASLLTPAATCILFGPWAEASCQPGFLTIRTCTLCCCCFCLLLLLLLLLLIFPHQRNRRRFALSFRSIYCCALNQLFCGYLHTKYTVRALSVSYAVLCSAACCCYCCCTNDVCVVVPDSGWKCFFRSSCVSSGFLIFTQNCFFYRASLGSTVAFLFRIVLEAFYGIGSP